MVPRKKVPISHLGGAEKQTHSFIPGGLSMQRTSRTTCVLFVRLTLNQANNQPFLQVFPTGKHEI